MSDKPMPEQTPPDLAKMTPEERKAFEKYGRLPKQSQLLAKKVHIHCMHIFSTMQVIRQLRKIIANMDSLQTTG
jgi:hypothetical protein